MNSHASNHRISIAESGAFVESFSLAPTAAGPLAPLKFAVKDLIDVAGHPTGCGNPTWRQTHGPATLHAVAVEQLLAAGAECVGKTVTDELAFSLIGENHFFGTPLNPAAPTRVPGGSSSGSASAVACGLADFAIGTDTGGSVRVPASNCGIWGFRPSHDRISLAGVMPFAPSFDTLGVLASSGRILENVASVLLAEEPTPASEPERILLLADAFELVDADVRSALEPAVERLRARWGSRVESIGIEALTGRRGRRGFRLFVGYVLRAAMGRDRQLARRLDCRGPARIRSGDRATSSWSSRWTGGGSARRRRPEARSAGDWPISSAPAICFAIQPSPPVARERRPGSGSDGRLVPAGLGADGHRRLGPVAASRHSRRRTATSPVGLSLVGAWGQDMQVIAAANRLVEGSAVSHGPPSGSGYAGASRAQPAPPRLVAARWAIMRQAITQRRGSPCRNSRIKRSGGA